MTEYPIRIGPDVDSDRLGRKPAGDRIELSAANDKSMHVVVLGTQPEWLSGLRGPLIRDMIAQGHQVTAIGAEEMPQVREALESWGARYVVVPIRRAGINPLADLSAMAQLWRTLRQLRPDMIFAYTVKPIVYGIPVAWLAGVRRRYAMISGLGYAFTGEARGKRKLVREIACSLYRLAMMRTTKVFFQNPDDAALFRELRLINSRLPVVMVNGSGVDTDHYSHTPLPDGEIAFLLIARLIGDKGIREYAEAAAQIRKKHPNATFHLVGGADPNPNPISPEEVSAWHDEGILHWHGNIDDVRPHIAACHVYVLPSYREGTPRSTLEAMAMGRAIITTDAPGCRETVRDGDNGFLVEPRCADSLAQAMQRFVERPELAKQMGKRSRSVAEEKYDVQLVNAVILGEMGLH